MFDTFRVLFTKFVTKRIFVFIFKIKSCLCEHRILFDNFVQNVDVEWKSFS